MPAPHAPVCARAAAPLASPRDLAGAKGRCAGTGARCGARPALLVPPPPVASGTCRLCLGQTNLANPPRPALAPRAGMRCARALRFAPLLPQQAARSWVHTAQVAQLYIPHRRAGGHCSHAAALPTSLPTRPAAPQHTRTRRVCRAACCNATGPVSLRPPRGRGTCMRVLAVMYMGQARMQQVAGRSRVPPSTRRGRLAPPRRTAAPPTGRRPPPVSRRGPRRGASSPTPPRT